MKPLLLSILMLFFIPSIGYSADPEPTSEQKELAKYMGVVYVGMSKADLYEVYSKLQQEKEIKALGLDGKPIVKVFNCKV